MTVTLLEVLAAGRTRRASVVAETAGSVVLAVADQLALAPRRLSVSAIVLLPEGGIHVDRGGAMSEIDCEVALRRLLGSLLELARVTAPALSRVSRRAPRGDLTSFVRELEAAMIPANRAAGRRALARLHRETSRAIAEGLPAAVLRWAVEVGDTIGGGSAAAEGDVGIAPGPQGVPWASGVKPSRSGSRAVAPGGDLPWSGSTPVAPSTQPPRSGSSLVAPTDDSLPGGSNRPVAPPPVVPLLDQGEPAETGCPVMLEDPTDRVPMALAEESVGVASVEEDCPHDKFAMTPPVLPSEAITAPLPLPNRTRAGRFASQAPPGRVDDEPACGASVRLEPSSGRMAPSRGGLGLSVDEAVAKARTSLDHDQGILLARPCSAMPIEESRSWIAPSVVAPLPAVVSAEAVFEVPPTPSDMEAAGFESPEPHRVRSPWRVRPAAGVFAPVSSNVDDLVERFAFSGLGEASVEEGLAAFVASDPSPPPAAVRPRTTTLQRLTASAARRRGPRPIAVAPPAEYSSEEKTLAWPLPAVQGRNG
ncbi:MAG: hypothetical protein JW751_30170 [Polyangiaceae bacterium]|nr:hypothetical protein [Polyangiaceae bacterium]